MIASRQVEHLTSGRLLARNTIWNLVGQILPMAVGLVSIPLIIRGLGVDRFGILSLAWIVVGYFSLFDLGIGRALTKLVADKLGANEDHAIPPLAWASLLVLFLLGAIGTVVVASLSPFLVHRVLKIPQALQTETLDGFYLLTASIPIVTTTAGLRGILEAFQRFRITNLIRIPMTAFSLVGPVLVLPFSHSLVPIIAVLIVGRLLGCAAHFIACFRVARGLLRGLTFNPWLLVPALKLGGWMTVSNLISPIMVYLDRFLIGALLSVGAVAFYTVPFDMVTRLFVIPGAVVGVLFPAFALSFAQKSDRTQLLLGRGLKYIFISTFPIFLIIVTLAPEGLRLWLGPEFARSSSTVLRWLAAGTFVTCLGLVPSAMIQGSGRPDITARLHLVELPLYLLSLWLLVRFHGIVGASMAWAGRVTLDAALLFFFAHRLLSGVARFLPRLAVAAAVGLLSLYAATFPEGIAMKAGLLSLGLLIFGVASWTWALSPSERGFLLGASAEPSQGGAAVTDVP